MTKYSRISSCIRKPFAPSAPYYIWGKFSLYFLVAEQMHNEILSASLKFLYFFLQVYFVRDFKYVTSSSLCVKLVFQNVCVFYVTQMTADTQHLYFQKLNSWTYNFVEVSRHNPESFQTFEVSLYNFYITNQFQTGVNPFVEVTVNSKEENSSDFCPHYVHEFGLNSVAS